MYKTLLNKQTMANEINTDFNNRLIRLRDNCPRPLEEVLQDVLDMLMIQERRFNELKSFLEVVEESNDRILNGMEAAEFCGVNRRTITRWQNAGRIHLCQKGCKKGFLLSELVRVNEVSVSPGVC